MGVSTHASESRARTTSGGGLPPLTPPFGLSLGVYFGTAPNRAEDERPAAASADEPNLNFVTVEDERRPRELAAADARLTHQAPPPGMSGPMSQGARWSSRRHRRPTLGT